jgi:leader peptidase (prepilin peptidase)/N-methyltransferase
MGSAFVLGLIIGSFLNVVIYRLPLVMEKQWRSMCDELFADRPVEQQSEPFNLITPGSRCPHCSHTITAIENIPLISYLILKGRCRGCGARISIRYPFVEFLSGVSTAIVIWQFGLTTAGLGALLFTWTLLALAFIDLDKQLLPDSITLLLLWFGLGFALFDVFVDLRTSVIGAMAGYLSLWIVYWVFKLLANKEGMGFGDFKLLAALGAWLGWQQLPVVVVTSSLVGAISGIAYLTTKRKERGTPIPFGPFLAMAGWLSLLWGDEIVGLYMDWSGLN